MQLRLRTRPDVSQVKSPSSNEKRRLLTGAAAVDDEHDGAGDDRPEANHNARGWYGGDERVATERGIVEPDPGLALDDERRNDRSERYE